MLPHVKITVVGPGPGDVRILIDDVEQTGVTGYRIVHSVNDLPRVLIDRRVSSVEFDLAGAVVEEVNADR